MITLLLRLSFSKKYLASRGYSQLLVQLGPVPATVDRKYFLKKFVMGGMVAHVSNPSTQEGEVAESQVGGQSEQYSKTPLSEQSNEQTKMVSLQSICRFFFSIFPKKLRGGSLRRDELELRAEETRGRPCGRGVTKPWTKMARGRFQEWGVLRGGAGGVSIF
jgi:hypothetical protein